MLFRQSGIYLLRIYNHPLEMDLGKYGKMVHFGRTDLSLAYFEIDRLVKTGNSPVFEWSKGGGMRETGLDFEPWLSVKWARARKRFRAPAWNSIVQGPEPFSAEELAIVSARDKFRWRKVGVLPTGNVEVEVFNGSERELQYLSVGVRGPMRNRPDEILTGGVSLPVYGILPGQISRVSINCYRDVVDPWRVELFEKPGLGPEDRDLCWDFKKSR
jgi:hypothetical protein